jgi:outer membrane protein OmpA-like peptidoglycan-associated protein
MMNTLKMPYFRRTPTTFGATRDTTMRLMLSKPVVPAQAGTQCRAPNDAGFPPSPNNAGFPPSRERRNVAVYLIASLLCCAAVSVPNAVHAQENCDAQFNAARVLAPAERIPALTNVLKTCPIFLAAYTLAVDQIDTGASAAALRTLELAEKDLLDKTNIALSAAVLGRQAQAMLANNDLIGAHGRAAAAQTLFDTRRAAASSKTPPEALPANPKWFDTVRANIERQLSEPAQLPAMAKVLEAQLAGNPVNKSFGVRPKIDLRVQFDFNQASLSAQGLKMVETLIASLQTTTPNGDIVLIGHTDTVGAKAYNQTLSERRASTVTQAILRAMPQLNGRVKSCGLGMDKPAFEGDMPDKDALNRRVELRFDAEPCAGRAIR